MQFPFSNLMLPEKSNKYVKPHPQSPKTTANFDHFLLGIWDLYIEKPMDKWRVPFYPLNVDNVLFISDLHYLWKAIYDLSSPLLFTRFAVSAALALLPAVSLWYASAATR